MTPAALRFEPVCLNNPKVEKTHKKLIKFCYNSAVVLTPSQTV
jgi:hypothetical protein